MDHERQAYLAAGMNDTVPKPLNPTRLLEAISASLTAPGDLMR